MDWAVLPRRELQAEVKRRGGRANQKVRTGAADARTLATDSRRYYSDVVYVCLCLCMCVCLWVWSVGGWEAGPLDRGPRGVSAGWQP
jgi:hypothetical protein